MNFDFTPANPTIAAAPTLPQPAATGAPDGFALLFDLGATPSTIGVAHAKVSQPTMPPSTEILPPPTIENYPHTIPAGMVKTPESNDPAVARANALVTALAPNDEARDVAEDLPKAFQPPSMPAPVIRPPARHIASQPREEANAPPEENKDPKSEAEPTINTEIVTQTSFVSVIATANIAPPAPVPEAVPAVSTIPAPVASARAPVPEAAPAVSTMPAPVASARPVPVPAPASAAPSPGTVAPATPAPIAQQHPDIRVSVQPANSADQPTAPVIGHETIARHVDPAPPTKDGSAQRIEAHRTAIPTDLKGSSSERPAMPPQPAETLLTSKPEPVRRNKTGVVDMIGTAALVDLSRAVSILPTDAPVKEFTANVATFASVLAADPVIERQLDLVRDEQWLGELAHDIASTSGDRDRLTFRLMPRQLGRLDIDLSRSHDGLSLTIRTENDSAQAILSAAQPRLAEEIRAQGLKLADTQMFSGDARQSHDQTSNARPAPLIEAFISQPESTDAPEEERRDGRYA